MGYNNNRDEFVEEKKDESCDKHEENPELFDDEKKTPHDSNPDEDVNDDAVDADEGEIQIVKVTGCHQQQKSRSVFSFGDASNQHPVQSYPNDALTEQQQQLHARLNGRNIDEATKKLLEQAVTQQLRHPLHQATHSISNLNPLTQPGPTSLNTMLNGPSTLLPTLNLFSYSSPVAVAQLQQQVLAQQQAAAHAAALSIGAVASNQTHLQDQQASIGALPVLPNAVPSMLMSPELTISSPRAIFTPFAATAPNALTGLNFGINGTMPAAPFNGLNISPANLVTGPLSSLSIAPTTTTGNPLAGPNHPAHHHHLLSPQHTIPHYVPPIPPTWGAQIPALTVQDRPLVPPIYNGINPNYPGAQMLHAHPPIFAVENFLSPAECDFLIEAAGDAFGPAPVVGKGAGEVSPSRTSSTCYLAREDLPEYLRKISLLTGKPAEHCELPQVGRYLPSQQYLQHFDAFDLSNEDGRRFAANGGQRTITVLTYLNDVPRGGATSFPNLNIDVQPRRGMALIFFPSTLDGLLDKMALHAALPAVDVKYVSQVWIRQSNYDGRPSKRLAAPMVAGLQERRVREEFEKRAQAQLLMGQLQLHQQQQQMEYQQYQQQHHHQHHSMNG